MRVISTPPSATTEYLAVCSHHPQNRRSRAVLRHFEENLQPNLHELHAHIMQETHTLG